MYSGFEEARLTELFTREKARYFFDPARAHGLGFSPFSTRENLFLFATGIH
jgi:hypothetical protein